MHASVRRAYAALARCEASEAEHTKWLASRAGEPDSLEHWRSMQPQPEPVKPSPSFRTDTQDAVLEQRMREFTSEIVQALAGEAGATVGRIERQFIDEIKKLNGEIALLKDEVAALKATNVRQIRGHRDAA